MLRAIRWVQLGAILFLFLLCVPMGAQQVVNCASDDMHRHFCPANTRFGVELQRQRSDSPCRQGYSWDYDRRGIWVDHGCRADFILGRDWDDRGWGRGEKLMSCSSDDMRRHYCSTDTSGGVRLVQQRSESECRRGYSWGYGADGIWVDRGCRADFEVGRPWRGHRWGDQYDRDDRDRGPGVVMSCTSDDGRRHYCGVDTWAGVTLIRQRSDSPCRLGETWGYDRQGIWVDRGCRAEFRTWPQ